MYGWAFHALAKGMQPHIENYNIDIVSAQEPMHFSQYDIVHAFGAYQRCGNLRCPVVKGIYNTNASIRNQPVSDLLNRLTSDATVLTAPTSTMKREVESFGISQPIFLLPEGVDTHIFPYAPAPTGALRVGWAGNPLRCYKRFYLAQQACKGIVDLQVADGTLSEKQMIAFYNSLDVILCTSEIGEGCPRPLIEAMSCGCFPVSFPVGVAPDVISHECTGLLVEDDTVTGMHSAIQWCKDHIDTIRNARRGNHNYILEHRSWPRIAPMLTSIYDTALGL